MPAFITIEDRKLMKIIDDLIILFGGPGMEAWLAADIGPYLAKRAGERFAQEGDDVVGAWAPLKPATVAIRQFSNYPVSGEHPINRRSGELENWVVQGGWRAYPTNYGAAMQYPGS